MVSGFLSARFALQVVLGQLSGNVYRSFLSSPAKFLGKMSLSTIIKKVLKVGGVRVMKLHSYHTLIMAEIL